MSDERLQELLGQPIEPTVEPPRKVTVDEALAIAIRLQQDERLDEAQEVLTCVLEQLPDYSPALHFAGVLAHQQGRTAAGIALVEKSLALEPDQPDWHSNLGILLQSAGRLDAAIQEYERAILLCPTHANAYSNLGVLLRATGKPAEAEAAYHKAIEIDPEHIDAFANLGILLQGLKRTPEAVACFCKVITLRPKHQEARKLLALAHCTIGEIDKAVKIFEEWLAEDPNDPVPRHMLAACTGREVPARASDGFVETTFDNFAASFESKLEKLSYRAPALVAAMLEDTGLEQNKRFEILDAGCGTGWCGPLLAPYARRLTGVDLSAGMLERAKEKNTYDELVKGELTAFLSDRDAAFDVIASADTLVYFGGLEEVAAAAAAALRPGGLIVFTVEHAGEAAVDYRLETHGRYAHSQEYVERVFTAVGLDVAIVLADLRLESGSPVSGMVVRAAKPAGVSKSGSAGAGEAVPVVFGSGVRDA